MPAKLRALWCRVVCWAVTHEPQFVWFDQSGNGRDLVSIPSGGPSPLIKVELNPPKYVLPDYYKVWGWWSAEKAGYRCARCGARVT